VSDGTSSRAPQNLPGNQGQTTLSSQSPGEFRLGSGDKVHVTVFGADQISGDYTVDPSGNLSVPLAGTIPAIGVTPPDLGTRIATKLRDQRMVTNPEVSVEVVSTRPFYILGEVEKPGEYPFRSGLNIVSAVATAGGFKYRADQDFVFVRRGGQGTEIRVPFASAAPIFPGDIIRIPGRFF
jgi:polysaccharide export outer membrane protein